MIFDESSRDVFTYPGWMPVSLAGCFLALTVWLGICLSDLLGWTDLVNEGKFTVSFIGIFYSLILVLFVWLLRELSMRVRLAPDRIVVSKWFFRKEVALGSETRVTETSDGQHAKIVVQAENQSLKVNNFIARYEVFVQRLHELAPGCFTGENEPPPWPVELKNYTRRRITKVGPLLAIVFFGIAIRESRSDPDPILLTVCVGYALFMLGWTAWLLMFDMRWLRFYPGRIEVNRGGNIETQPISALGGLRWKSRSSYAPGVLEVEVGGKTYTFPVRIGSKESLRVLYWQLCKAYGLQS